MTGSPIYPPDKDTQKKLEKQAIQSLQNARSAQSLETFIKSLPTESRYKLEKALISHSTLHDFLLLFMLVRALPFIFKEVKEISLWTGAK